MTVAGQHMENLFRRFKGEVVDVKTVSGGIYSGRIIEITNDYICITETSGTPGQQVFLFFTAIESMAATTTE
ncbi:MAG TPA: hypothetical protein VFH46_09700 [Pyrinomonadaceae bacterium]|nr:hypothetical protein [Pyrinomonadaceae bacterium]